MTAGRRMGLAFVSTVLGVLLFCVLGSLPPVLRYGIRYAWPTVQMLPVYLMFAIPGWLLALPFVLFLRDAAGWRGWATVAIGTALGPLFMGSWALLSSGGHLQWKQNGIGILLSVEIGFLTTITYVILSKAMGRVSSPDGPKLYTERND